MVKVEKFVSIEADVSLLFTGVFHIRVSRECNHTIKTHTLIR